MLSPRQAFLRHVAQTSDAPLLVEIERAEGLFLYGPDDRRWLDLISGIAVSNLGHGHPAVVSAVQDQAARYMHTMVYGEFVQGPQVRLAEALTNALPPELDSVYFVNSGSEAVEGALKLAKRLTGRTRLFGFRNSYHGSSHGALSMGGDEAYKRVFRPLLPEVQTHVYGSDEVFNAIDERVAAVLVEVVQAEAGVHAPPAGWLAELRAACDRSGTLLIFDEIQTGCGRTGTLFAFEQAGVVPDILLLAKAFGGGMPLGAFVASRERMGSLTHDPVLGHITTFGGHPVSCAGALAAWQVLREENLPARAEAAGERFAAKLHHTAIRDVRRSGLLMALEFDSFEFNKRVIDACLEAGLMTDWFLYAPHCLRIAAPLIIDDASIDFACDTLLGAIEREHND